MLHNAVNAFESQYCTVLAKHTSQLDWFPSLSRFPKPPRPRTLLQNPSYTHLYHDRLSDDHQYQWWHDKPCSYMENTVPIPFS